MHRKRQVNTEKSAFKTEGRNEQCIVYRENKRRNKRKIVVNYKSIFYGNFRRNFNPAQHPEIHG